MPNARLVKRSDLLRGFRQIGFSTGDVVFFHSSLAGLTVVQTPSLTLLSARLVRRAQSSFRRSCSE